MEPAERRHALEALPAVFEALAHPVRRQILMAILFRGGALAAGEIAGGFNHAWPTTTRHLRVLEDAGLVVQEKVGRKRVYRIVHGRIALAAEWLSHFVVDAPAAGGRRPTASHKVKEPVMGDRDKALEMMREICLSLPDTDEMRAWGEPHFRIGGRIFASCGQTIVVQLEAAHAQEIVRTDPRFRRYTRVKDCVEIDAGAVVSWDEMRALVLEIYRLNAPGRRRRAAASKKQPRRH